MKNGTPIIDVIIPTGISSGEIIVLAIMSDASSMMPPMSPDAGMRYLLSTPTRLRAIWGATRPTNPMTPLNAMHIDEMSVTVTSDTVFRRFTFTPRVAATSSPAFSALKSQAHLKTTMKPRMMNGMTIAIASQLAPQNPPISHVSRSLRASALDMYFRTDSPAENRLPIAVPVKINTVTLLLHSLDIPYTTPRDRQPKRNANKATAVYPVNIRFAPNRLYPRTIARAAPKDAPLETPRVYGDARGLRSRFCIMHPLSPRAMAVSMQSTSLGRRISVRMYILNL